MEHRWGATTELSSGGVGAFAQTRGSQSQEKEMVKMVKVVVLFPASHSPKWRTLLSPHPPSPSCETLGDFWFLVIQDSGTHGGGAIATTDMNFTGNSSTKPRTKPAPTAHRQRGHRAYREPAAHPASLTQPQGTGKSTPTTTITPIPVVLKRRRTNSSGVNRTGGNGSDRFRPVLKRSKFKIWIWIQNLNLNSKNEKISQNSQKYFKVCKI
jgi:predicted outer membrane repeat protein